MSEGFVYILSSANSPFVKIGGTEFPPAIRLRAINTGSAYEEHGPWPGSRPGIKFRLVHLVLAHDVGRVDLLQLAPRKRYGNIE